MALTAADFFRHLPHALHGFQASSSAALSVIAERPGQRVVICAAPLETRRIGPTLALPRLLVTIDVAGGDEEGFVAAFDRAFHRGGG